MCEWVAGACGCGRIVYVSRFVLLSLLGVVRCAHPDACQRNDTVTIYQEWDSHMYAVVSVGQFAVFCACINVSCVRRTL